MLLLWLDPFTSDPKMLLKCRAVKYQEGINSSYLSLFFEKGKFQLRSALSGNCIAYSTIISHGYLHLKLVWKCEYENDILHIYKGRTLLVRRGNNSGAGIATLIKVSSFSL